MSTALLAATTAFVLCRCARATPAAVPVRVSVNFGGLGTLNFGGLPKSHCHTPHTATIPPPSPAMALPGNVPAALPAPPSLREMLQRQNENSSDGRHGHGGGGGRNREGDGGAPLCDAGFCVGPPRCYPTSADLTWYAEFDVPPLPPQFDSSSMTDYIYFNLVFGYGQPHDNPGYPDCEPYCAGDGWGRFNQFVPQLMLGSVLCNSTNAGKDPSNGERYSPKWCKLDNWAIGAQYFFAEYGCANRSTAGNCGGAFKAHAATGDLIPVHPGETVYTKFDRVGPGADAGWRLTMGVTGDRVPASVVVADKPYMGLVNGDPSWSDPAFTTAYAGSCWELYGQNAAANYPPFMHYKHTIVAEAKQAFWAEWGVDEGNASTPCRALTIENDVSADGRTQHVEVNATMR